MIRWWKPLRSRGLPGCHSSAGWFTPLQSSGLQTVADALGATAMQVALAWLLQRSPNILLIPGTSSVAHLQQNLAAGDLVLPSDALDTLNSLVD